MVEPSSKEASPSTPLLAGIPSTTSHDNTSNGSGLSVRQVRVERKDFLTSIEELDTVECGKLPIGPLDKTFQDHTKLYNDLLGNYHSLKDRIHDFKAVFEYDCKGIPILTDCMKHLAKRCGAASLTATRTKYSITIEYDRQEVAKRCTGLAEDTIEALELFNRITKLCKNILEKAPKVKNSVQVVLDDEQRLRREVSKSDLSSTEAPDVMKVCVANINKLRKLPGAIETIQKYTLKQFNEVKESSKYLFAEPK